MDMDALSIVKWGDKDSLGSFLFENGTQHKVFQETFMDQGISVPVYPLTDADTDNLDDWLQVHQVEHQAFAGLLGLNNPFNLLDTDWNNESDFYDWLASHLYIHEQIAAALNLNYGTSQSSSQTIEPHNNIIFAVWINNSSNQIPWTNIYGNQVQWY
jgi:hypothetical protein